MKKKRLTALVMAFIMTITTALPVMATETKESGTVTSSNTEISMEATNSFGKMLTSEIQEETQAQEANNGYNVFSVEMEGNIATVSLETAKAATLVVAIYDEAGEKMITSGYTQIIPDDVTATVEIETEDMPEYYYLRAYIVDGENYKPYSTVFECPTYTKEMQEFLAKSTADFDADKIINFDESNTTNFGVLNEETIVVESEEGKNEVKEANDDTQTYVFENADATITSLKKGDNFTYECEDGTVLIVNVASVKIDGTTATITGQDASMEEVFDYVKIDTESTTKDATIDDSTCDEGVTYEGLVEDETTARSVDVENKENLSASLKVDKSLGNNAKIAGSLKLKMESYVKLYITTSYHHVEVSLDYSVGIDISLSGKAEGELVLVKFQFVPIVGVIIDVTPLLDVEVSAKVELSGTLSGTVGFRVVSEEGLVVLASTPKFKTELKGEVEVFIGLPLKPSISLINENLVKGELGAKAGVEIKATKTFYTSSADTRHQCSNCIAGEINGVVEVSAGATLFNVKWLSWEVKKEWEMKICDFYWSIDHSEFGFSTCPHLEYLITVTVLDANGKGVSGITINNTYITDSNGKVGVYLPEGEQQIAVTRNGAMIGAKKIIVGNKAGSVLVRLNAAQIKVKELINYQGSVAALLEDGSLYTWGSDFITEDTMDGRYYWDFDNGRHVPQKILNDIVHVDMSGPHNMAINKNGELWVWSNVVESQNAGTGKHSQPVKMLDNVVTIVQDDYSEMYGGFTAITNDNNLWQTSYDWDVNYIKAPQSILDNVKQYYVGYGDYAVIKTNGSLWMWGKNRYGAIGNGTTEEQLVPIKVLDNVREFYIHSDASATIKTDGSLWMWGKNWSGCIGNGTTEEQLVPIKVLDDVKHFYTNGDTSAAIKTDGSLWMWGANRSGQIGNGKKGEQLVPVKILDDVKSVEIASYCTAVIKTDGSLWMWGDNSYGQIGNGMVEDQLIPIKVLDNVKSLISMYNYMTAIKTDGSLWMWGENHYGQIGNGTKETQLVPIKILDNVEQFDTDGYRSTVIKTDGSLWRWGQNYGGIGNGTTEDQLVPVKVLDNVKCIIFDSSYVAVIKKDNSLWMWGDNFRGLIGNGTTEDQLVPIKVLDNVKSIYPNYNYIAVIKMDGSLWMWGENKFGQLGNGTTTDSLVPMNISGAFMTNPATVRTLSLTDSIYSLEHPSAWTTHDAGSVTPSTDGTSGTASFGSLIAGETYNFYIMKDRTAVEPLSSGNLLYISQAVASENGTLDITFSPKESWEGADVFVSCMTGGTEDFPFYDVYKTDWYYAPVAYVNDNGIMTGMSEGIFGPYVTLSRAQFAVMLYRLEGQPKVTYANQFPDVSGDTWYTAAVAWASENGIITGYANGYFGAVDNITREQMATIMYRYAKNKGFDVSETTALDTFTDHSIVSEFAKNAMSWTVGKGIITGKDNGTRIAPQENAARAECATIFMRYMTKY